jgi:3-deoxy-D-manno-octulosonic-acid transferase
MPATAASTARLSPPATALTSWSRWQAFRALEKLSDLRGNVAASGMELRAPARPQAAIWAFVSTIGEMNAVDPLLRRIVERCAPRRLVLITDHPHYRASYEARFPDAVVCVSLGHSQDAAQLARHYPPGLLVVAEIPCLPHDAPCRFSFAFVLEAKRRQAPAAVLNGWLYRYEPASRMDAIETRWFSRDYLQAFDRLCVQDMATRDQLIAAGAPQARVIACGNVKFDAMVRPDWSPERARSPAMLQGLLAAGRPVVVAGCVTDYAEQAMVLDAFVMLRAQAPEALLVLAPRHPEVAERMQTLRRMLSERAVQAVFRSQTADAKLDTSVDCLVLDTMGELRDFFAAASVAHMGVDHNVLEPLGFGKPVTVVPGWKSIYPSYPVYRKLMERQALTEATQARELASIWRTWLEQPETRAIALQRAADALAQERGAVARHLDALDACLRELR